MKKIYLILSIISIHMHAAKDQITNQTPYTLSIIVEYPGWFCTNNSLTLASKQSHEISAGTCSLGSLTISTKGRNAPALRKKVAFNVSNTPSVSRKDSDFNDIVIMLNDAQTDFVIHFRTEQERIDEGRAEFQALFK